MDNDWERVPEGHPEQCETPRCMNKRLEGSRFCAAHGGNKGNEAYKRRELKNYRIAKWNSKLLEKKDSSEVKSLLEEIAILRELLQAHMCSCEDEADLMLKSGPISDLTTKLNTLITSCNTNAKLMGDLIDKEKVVGFAQAIIEIISPHLTEENIDEVNSKIQEALNNL